MALVRGEMSDLLGALRGANMNSTADQAIPIQAFGLPYYVTSILAVWKSGASLTLAAGGVYDAAAKAGNQLVSSAQVFSALTGAGKALALTLAAAATGSTFTATSLFLSLTVAQGAAATCDIYVYGRVLD